MWSIAGSSYLKYCNVNSHALTSQSSSPPLLVGLRNCIAVYYSVASLFNGKLQYGEQISRSKCRISMFKCTRYAQQITLYLQTTDSELLQNYRFVRVRVRIGVKVRIAIRVKIRAISLWQCRQPNKPWERG